MQPLGTRILVRDIIEEKKTESGLIDLTKDPLKKVRVELVSQDISSRLEIGDICLSQYGGVEIEKGLWLCDESLLWMKL